MDTHFAQSALFETLQSQDPAALDALPFGIISMRSDGIVLAYNAFESRLAGLATDHVVGRHFFTQVAPCTNNYLVAERFETEPALDDLIDYVFTLRMQPTKVRLRLLKGPGQERMFLAVERR